MKAFNNFTRPTGRTKEEGRRALKQDSSTTKNLNLFLTQGVILERPGISGHELNPGSFARDWIRANSTVRSAVCDQKGIREIRDIKIANMKNR
jgi:hypothetical protein